MYQFDTIIIKRASKLIYTSNFDEKMCECTCVSVYVYEITCYAMMYYVINTV